MQDWFLPDLISVSNEACSSGEERDIVVALAAWVQASRVIPCLCGWKVCLWGRDAAFPILLGTRLIVLHAENQSMQAYIS